MMIEFNGTVKDFFKNYPKENRKVGETYRIITSKGSNDYQFVDKISEKNFKRVSDIVESDSEDQNFANDEFKQLQKMASDLLQLNNNWELYNVARYVSGVKSLNDLMNEDFCAQFNVLYRFQDFVDSEESEWEDATRSDYDLIRKFVYKLDDFMHENCSYELDKYLIDKYSLDDFHRFHDEYEEVRGFLCCPSGCSMEFDFRSSTILKNLVRTFDRLNNGYLIELNNFTEDYAKFGEIYGDKSLDKDVYYQGSVKVLFKYFNEALMALFMRYAK